MYLVPVDRNNTSCIVSVFDIVKYFNPYAVSQPGFYVSMFKLNSAKAIWFFYPNNVGFNFNRGVEVCKYPQTIEPQLTKFNHFGFTREYVSSAINVPLYLDQRDAIYLAYKIPARLSQIQFRVDFTINYLITETTTI